MSSETQPSSVKDQNGKSNAKDSAIKLAKADTFIQKMQRWANSKVLFPIPFGLADDSLEFISSITAEYSIEDHGLELNNYSPEEADLLIIGGLITRKAAPILKRVYEKMPEPKWVIAIENKDQSELFSSYNTVSNVSEIVPVDVSIDTNSLSPASFIEGVESLKKIIKEGKK